MTGPTTSHRVQVETVKMERRCDTCSGLLRFSYVGAPTPWWCSACRSCVGWKWVRKHV